MQGFLIEDVSERPCKPFPMIKSGHERALQAISLVLGAWNPRLYRLLRIHPWLLFSAPDLHARWYHCTPGSCRTTPLFSPTSAPRFPSVTLSWTQLPLSNTRRPICFYCSHYLISFLPHLLFHLSWPKPRGFSWASWDPFWNVLAPSEVQSSLNVF